MDLHALQPGYMLSEYRIERLLGEGGFGLTYLGFDTNLEKMVAIKEYMPSEFSLRQDGTSIVPKSQSNKDIYNWGLKAFINEAKILARFENVNIVKIFRFIETNGTAYIIMEYCEGGCLNDYLSKDKPMNEAQVQEILLPIMSALQQVHEQGILHRDIKPENIMFRSDNTPVLIDFGAAREALTSKTRNLTKIYTPGYAPLEQYSAEGEVGPWSDIYSLAAVAYICLTGKRPADILNRMHDDPVKKLSSQPNASNFLKSIDKSLSVSHEDRPKTIIDWVKIWNKHAVSELESVTTMQNSETIISRDSLHNYQKQVSAQTEVSLRGNSAIDANTSEFSHIHHRNENEKPSSFWKKAAILIPILLASAWGFKYYLDQASIVQKQVMQNQFQELLASKKKALEVTNKMSQEELIKNIQKQLKNLYANNLKVTGIVDITTLDTIKAFEKDYGLLESGSVSEELLAQIVQTYNSKDKSDWEKALKRNTYEAFLDYQLLHQNGKFFQDANDKVDQILNRNRNRRSQANNLADSSSSTEDSDSSSYEFETNSEISNIPSNLISSIQRELKRIKYNDLEVTGSQDFVTTAAIKSYNWTKNQTNSGTPNESLLAQLKSETRWPGFISGEKFQHCTVCPEMVVIPKGTYIMGSINGEKNETPRHNVTIKELSISTTEITFKQWDACVNSGGCSHIPDDNEWGRENNSVINVNWHDTQKYISWLKQKTGQRYRLLTESEWEYAARGRTTTEYPWGEEIGENNAYCSDCKNDIEFSLNTNLPVKSFQPNAFGLYDMVGGVWEWVEDCWHPNYLGAPSDGSAWEDPNCVTYTLRSASPGNSASEHRTAHRGAADATRRSNSIGFRIAMDL